MSGRLARLAATSKALKENHGMATTKSTHHPRLHVPPPEDRTSNIIVSLDPGPNFGVATYHPYPSVAGHNFDLETHKFGKDGHEQLELLIYQLHGIRTSAILQAPPETEVDSILIIEKFEFRKDDQARDRIDYTAAEYVGVAKLCGRQVFDKVVLQGSSEAKGFWNDDKLRALGLYGDTRHSRDALRHLLKFMTFNRSMNQRWLLQGLKEK